MKKGLEFFARALFLFYFKLSSSDVNVSSRLVALVDSFSRSFCSTVSFRLSVLRCVRASIIDSLMSVLVA